MELSKRKSASDYIRTLILFGFVYDVDYSYLRQYNETIGQISGNMNKIEKRVKRNEGDYGTGVEDAEGDVEEAAADT